MAVSGERPITVLHVDDDPDFVDIASTFLERESDRLTVETAPDAGHGLEHLYDRHPDCIISDYEMPGQNGIEFLKAVREDYPELPFILFTGKGSEEVASHAISEGVSDYLQKEVGTDQYAVLANRIENAVDKHRAEELVDRAFHAMDQSREGIALLNEDGEFIYVNESYCEIVGYEHGELIGTFWELVYPDEQAERIYEEILKSVPEQGHWTGDTVYQRKDGSRLLVSHALAYSEEGTMICLLRDLSDTELHQQTLREERKRFDLFVDAVEDYAIFMLDPNGYVTTWNRGAERIKGYQEAEILGNHISTFYTDDQLEEGLPDRLLQEALAEGSVRHRGPRVRKDGTTFQAKVVITAVFDENDNHRGFGKVTQDLGDLE